MALSWARSLTSSLTWTATATATWPWALSAQPGQHGDLHRHGGDESLYVLEGTLNLFCPENEGQKWFELSPQDGFYLPMGAVHGYHNITDKPVMVIFGVAPSYLSVGS